jgi:hypothetical protein
MIYFFHHYELPVIMQQARIQQIIIETRTNANRGDDISQNATGTTRVEEQQQQQQQQQPIVNINNNNADVVPNNEIVDNNNQNVASN